MPYMTVVLGGYYICRDQLRAWSKKEVQVNPLWKRCLDAEGGLVDSGLEYYFEKLRLNHLIETQEPPKAEYGCCGPEKCCKYNFIFYRRYAQTWSMAKFKPKDWARFEERPSDRAAKLKIEKALNMTLPEWSIIVWGGGETALYNPTPEMFEEREDEPLELLSDSPPESGDVVSDDC